MEKEMENFDIKLVKLKDNATVPTYGSEEAAGADLYACIDGSVEILPQKTVLITTGIAIQIPRGYVGLIYARSGIATKRGLAPANKVGVIDSDYRGEIMVALHNHSDIPQIVENGERIAQIVITPYITANFVPCEQLDDSERGSSGFGSTGK